MKREFYSNGKLLLTGEYVVLDGATALAIPTVYGQSLSVENSQSGLLNWKSVDDNGNIWFRATFSPELDIIKASDQKVAQSLQKILKTAKLNNPAFLDEPKGFSVETTLDFPRDWGLGTSSTLINNIAQWAGVDAFTLLDESFGGSGYDIAAAQNTSPLLYKRVKGKPQIETVSLNWDFMDRLYFVHLNKKQDSKEGIARYRALQGTDTTLIERISGLSSATATCLSLDHLTHLLDEHEALISKLLQLPNVKAELFPDYPGLVKSLGAWGGDFVLISAEDNDLDFFRKKGYQTIVAFSKMLA